MALNQSIEHPGPVVVRVFAENTGHEPATDVVYRFNEFLVPYIPEGPGRTTINQPNNTCDGVNPSSENGMAIYPGTTKVHIESDFEDTLGSRAIAAKVRDRSNTLIVEGCIAYRTFNSTHVSKFRFFLRDVPGPGCVPIPNDDIKCSWRFNSISYGNEAN
jgi:hypothetical protein